MWTSCKYAQGSGEMCCEANAAQTCIICKALGKWGFFCLRWGCSHEIVLMEPLAFRSASRGALLHAPCPDGSNQPFGSVAEKVMSEWLVPVTRTPC